MPKCNGLQMPAVVSNWKEPAFLPWDENAEPFKYTCINDQGAVKVRFREKLPHDYLLTSGLVDFDDTFDYDLANTISANQIEFGIPFDGQSADENGITTLRATLGTRMDIFRSRRPGSNKETIIVRDHGENYKIECRIRTSEATAARTTTTEETTTESFVCPTVVCPTVRTTRATVTRPTPAPTVQYRVTLATSSTWHSGTDDDIYIELVGKTGTSGMKVLRKGNKTGVDQTTTITATYHGPLEKVWLFKGGNDGWKASGSRPMKIQYNAEGRQFLHQFKEGEWLTATNPVWEGTI